ncbi:MAG TPA: hypothetical protein VEB40_09435 [Flavipsychrobacter sp.]|nr:hypothetical protein [Flavipsychrobacter sp.]
MNTGRTFKATCITALACLGLFATITAGSCKKEKADKVGASTGPAFNIAEIMECHNSKNRYPSQIVSALEGTWLWVSNTCFWTGDSTFTADRHVVITFSDAAVYKVFEDGKIESEGTWTLSQSGDNIWSISTTGYSRYLNGYIYLCEDEVVFYSSFMDGCDFYFIRK